MYCCWGSCFISQPRLSHVIVGTMQESLCAVLWGLVRELKWLRWIRSLPSWTTAILRAHCVALVQYFIITHTAYIILAIVGSLISHKRPDKQSYGGNAIFDISHTIPPRHDGLWKHSIGAAQLFVKTTVSFHLDVTTDSTWELWEVAQYDGPNAWKYHNFCNVTNTTHATVQPRKSKIDALPSVRLAINLHLSVIEMPIKFWKNCLLL